MPNAHRPARAHRPEWWTPTAAVPPCTSSVQAWANQLLTETGNTQNRGRPPPPVGFLRGLHTLPFCYLHIIPAAAPISDLRSACFCLTAPRLLQHPNITRSSQPLGDRPQHHRTTEKERVRIEAESRRFSTPPPIPRPRARSAFIILHLPQLPQLLPLWPLSLPVSALHARMVQTSLAVRLPEDIDARVKETRYGSG